MELKELKPKKALNKAFLKVKPNRTEIEGFKTNLIQLLNRTNDTESEEFWRWAWTVDNLSTVEIESIKKFHKWVT